MTMLTALLAVCPVFGLIVAGFASGKLRLLGPAACSELNRFVVFLALPALLFQVMATADWASLWQPGFIAAFAIGAFVVFGGTVAMRMRRGQGLADAVLDGLNAGYANAGYIGFPLCELVFGRQSFALVTVAAILTICVLFGVAIIFVEIALRRGPRTHTLVLTVGRSLLRNPLLLAPVLGAGWTLLGVKLPDSVGTFLHMLGGAASPCALVSLGLFLARERAGVISFKTSSMLAGLKLFVQPAITGALVYLFRLPAEAAGIAVLIAALPTGTGPFMLAEFYGREAVTTSGTILVSTVASVVSLTGCILVLRSLALI
jgi:malonate transporter and related proteins